MSFNSILILIFFFFFCKSYKINFKMQSYLILLSF